MRRTRKDSLQDAMWALLPAIGAIMGALPVLSMNRSQTGRGFADFLDLFVAFSVSMTIGLAPLLAASAASARVRRIASISTREELSLTELTAEEVLRARIRPTLAWVAATGPALIAFGGFVWHLARSEDTDGDLIYWLCVAACLAPLLLVVGCGAVEDALRIGATERSARSRAVGRAVWLSLLWWIPMLTYQIVSSQGDAPIAWSVAVVGFIAWMTMDARYRRACGVASLYRFEAPEDPAGGPGRPPGSTRGGWNLGWLAGWIGAATTAMLVFVPFAILALDVFPDVIGAYSPRPTFQATGAGQGPLISSPPTPAITLPLAAFGGLLIGGMQTRPFAWRGPARRFWAPWVAASFLLAEAWGSSWSDPRRGDPVVGEWSARTDEYFASSFNDLNDPNWREGARRRMEEFRANSMDGWSEHRLWTAIPAAALFGIVQWFAWGRDGWRRVAWGCASAVAYGAARLAFYEGLPEEPVVGFYGGGGFAELLPGLTAAAAVYGAISGVAALSLLRANRHDEPAVIGDDFGGDRSRRRTDTPARLILKTTDRRDV